MYDSTCKFIALEYSRDLATWLLGKPLELTEIKPSELSLEPIRADTLIFLESEELILHIEFQTDPKEDIPYRMLDYATRLYRRYPHKPIHQVVIYLRKSDSPKVRQNDYKQGKTSHQFEVIRLWEQFTNIMLVMLIAVAVVSAVLDLKKGEFPKDAIAIFTIVNTTDQEPIEARE